MDKLDKERFQRQQEELEREGKPAIWKGGPRYCSPYPDLLTGMRGILREGFFYPEAWKYRYSVLGKPENVEITGDTPEHQPKLL